ncbi:MAG: carboxypeptidase-like regulatory domain-containing protein [Candidatus Sericytochromatia bacterium]|nr:carboxypeptidase-like regulatory domain-containing protein [Candidatus Sericytochromatia bacterium]
MTRPTYSLRPALAVALLLAACTPAPTGGLPAPVPEATPAASPSAAPSASPATAPSQPAGFAVRGLVVDLDRTPVASATVVARAGDAEVGQAVTAGDGSYTLTLPAGRYDVTASKEGLTRRTRAVEVAGEATLHFGPQPEELGNPFFLADDPEIEAVTVEEREAGQGLAVSLALSEPLTEAGRQAFADAFRLYAGSETEFLKLSSTSVARRQLAGTWDDAGRVFTARYEGPYLASGEGDVFYAVALLQDELEDEKDPVTRETKWEDLGLVDAGGRALGRGQTRYAFKKAELFELGAQQLTDPLFGYFVQDRRWRLTHEGRFRFRARRDETPPALVSAQLRRDREVGTTSRADILTLTLSEPMSAAKDAKELDWTRLDKDRELVVLNGSELPTGPEFKPMSSGLRVREVVVDTTDARVVELLYPVGTFDDLKRVEVTLGPDMRDPAGNRPDPERSKAVVTVN